VLAVSVVPLLCVMFLKPGSGEGDPYGGAFYQGYKKLLIWVLHHRAPVVALMVGLLGVSLVGFGYVDQAFMPPSTRPQFTIDFYARQGNFIGDTSNQMTRIEDWLSGRDEVASYATFVGQGALRFILTYNPPDANPAIGQIIVEVKNPQEMEGFMAEVQAFLDQSFPQAQAFANLFQRGSSSDAKIEARFRGREPDVLRKLANQASEVMMTSGNALFVRTDWRQRELVYRPVLNDAKARRAGLTRPDAAAAIEQSFDGRSIGLYREDDELLPIMVRPPDAERNDVNDVNNVQIWSSAVGRSVPLGQVISGFESVWEDGIVWRRDRLPTITVKTSPHLGDTTTFFNELRPQIESIELPPGYTLEWGGEYESSSDAQAGLMRMLPLSFIAMALIIVMLFNALRQPLIILLGIPLIVIGMVFGLLVFDQPFSFMAMLGFLSLIGMMIKNAIVLLDQIDSEIESGKERFSAIVDSGISRVRPVLMAAMTTVLGMVPLLFDELFASMAVTIMFGLTFATVLTLLVIPALYSLFFRITDPSRT
jgi:multidrug efflux pump subunit AcrB